MASRREETTWKQITFYLLTLAILVVCGFLLYPFFMAIIGAIVLAVITQRPYDWLASKIRHRSTAAAVAVILVMLAVIVPGYFLAQNLGKQALTAISVLRDDANQQKFSEFIGGHPTIASGIETISNSIDPGHAAQTAAAYVGSKLAGALGNSFRAITQIVVMLFVLFFLFRDRDLALDFLRSLLPLHEEESHELLDRVGDTIYATALGRLAVAGVQGVLAGLAFWVLGVPGIILWSFSTALFAMIPAFGAFLVWGPIAIYLGISGHWGKAALLAIWGGVVVSTIDNFLYPILVGTRLRSHTATILISILGGIAVFGIIGVILGPVTFTIAATLLDLWHRRLNDPHIKLSNPV
ncbi:AI-2E family transporter [Edaphobacter dinghuensis]|uniref:AI-2E family transporter n=1 Tax=Edaphobacter dinghuensis TaxID=1560005 RepID=A0A917M792_9BACT|nr:AI-2E family transporter [Edaphobacter dinghuensis]GGG82168.1 AI-2E family transporter [Edaphobacter dinghuensis]